MDDWEAVVSILGVGGILYWKLYLIERNLKKDSKEAHARIEGNVKDSENRVTASVKADVDRIYNLISTLITMIGNRKGA